MLTYKELKEKCDCWKGYKRKPGTKPCADGSCVKEEATKPIGADKHHVLAFGRMNPITSGHEAVVNKVHSVAKEHGASHNVVVSHSQDAKKNPLSGDQKVKHAKNAFPETNVSSASKEAPTILHHAAAAHKAGATHLHVVAGSDRHEEMHNLLHKYNGKDSAHGHYNFKKITVHSSGERDPDSEGTTGISASKMREHAASGNKEAFHAGAPSKMKPEHKDAMYHDVRKGMNIKEETTPYWKKPSFNKRMSKMAKQERLERERKEAEKKPVKEETVDQQDDRTKQLKRFKDQVAALLGGNSSGLHDPDQPMHPRHAKIKHMTETLHPDMGAGAYINDFIKSTNPRFNNKSKAERRKMAIGAYMAAKASIKEGTEQPNGTDKIDTQTSAPTASTAKDTTMGKKIKGFKFFQGQNEPNTVREEKKTVDIDKVNAAGEEPHHEKFETVKKKTVKEQAPVAPTIARKYIKGTPEHKAHKEKSKPINGHPTNTCKEEVEALDEKSQQARRNKTYKNLMAASKGARVNQDLGMTPADTGHKNRQQMNKAIGRAISRGEVHEASTGNPGAGYHGTVPTADDKYEELHAHVKNLTDGDDKTVKHYLDSGFGAKLAGKEDDHEHIKKDFEKFMKYYRPKEVEKVEERYEDNRTGFGRRPREDDEYHVPDPEIKKTKVKKEETMKSYKEFLQSLDEKLIGKQKKLDKNHNNKLDSQDFAMLRKEEAESLDEIKMADLPSRKIQGKSYGASYEDPEGAFETKDDMKKPEKKAAGRKIGQSVGSYKRRQPKAAS
jgi:hypothetical protein